MHHIQTKFVEGLVEKPHRTASQLLGAAPSEHFRANALPPAGDGKADRNIEAWLQASAKTAKLRRPKTISALAVNEFTIVTYARGE
jgi:hypothetical protein